MSEGEDEPRNHGVPLSALFHTITGNGLNKKSNSKLLWKKIKRGGEGGGEGKKKRDFFKVEKEKKGKRRGRRRKRRKGRKKTKPLFISSP